MATSKFDIFNSLVYKEEDFAENKILLKVTTGKKYVNNTATDENEYRYEMLAMGKINDILIVKSSMLFVNLEELETKKKMLVKTKGLKIKPYEAKTGEIKWTGTVETIEVVKGQEAKTFDELFK